MMRLAPAKSPSYAGPKWRLIRQGGTTIQQTSLRWQTMHTSICVIPLTLRALPIAQSSRQTPHSPWISWVQQLGQESLQAATTHKTHPTSTADPRNRPTDTDHYAKYQCTITSVLLRRADLSPPAH
jgi:hypothetical protein